TAAGRASTNIDAIRLSAHSRGHRGIENTMGLVPGSAPLIDLKLVEKVSVFDASWADLGKALTAHRKDLTAMTDSKGNFKPDAVQLYDVVTKNVSGFKGTQLDPSGVRALSYVRFVQDALARGSVTGAVLTANLDPTVDAATKRLLAAIPARGNFSSK